jgi:hypothetical protein
MNRDSLGTSAGIWWAVVAVLIFVIIFGAGFWAGRQTAYQCSDWQTFY